MIIFKSRDPKGQSTIKLEDWRRVAGYLIPEWVQTLKLLFCIVVSSALIVVPGLLMRDVIDKAIPERNFPLLALLVAGMILAPLIANLLSVWQSYIATRLGQDVMLDIRNEMYDRLLMQSMKFYTNTRTAEALSRLQNDVGGIQNVVSTTMVNMISNALIVITTTIVIIHLDWRLSIVAIGVLPIFILPTRKVGQARGRIAGKTQEVRADFASYVQERVSINGFLLIRLFGARDAERKNFNEKADAIRDLMIEQNSLGRWYLMFVMSFVSVGPALIYLIGGWEAIRGVISVGTIVAFVNFLTRLYSPATALVNAQVELISASALFRRIFSYLDLPIELEEPSAPVTIANPQGVLSFKNVSFSYGDKSGKLALDNVCFDVPPGKMVALVGPSGAGKTSISYLAMRFYDPDGGHITLDNVDLRHVAQHDLSSLITGITQEAIFFNSTIKESLLYANPNATDEELHKACEISQIGELIATLPDGLMTKIGEKGYKLSGGERQRLALARIALRNPKLVILDEATSSLDSRSESQVSEALKSLLVGRSSLVIAHRLSTIIKADLILVIDKGRIVGQGTHTELLARGGLYEKLYHEQFLAHKEA